MMQVINYVIGQTPNGTICIQTCLLCESGRVHDAHYISSIDGTDDRQLILRPADEDEMDLACVLIIDGNTAVKSGYDEALKSASNIILVQYPDDKEKQPITQMVPLVVHESMVASIQYFMTAQCAS